MFPIATAVRDGLLIALTAGAWWVDASLRSEGGLATIAMAALTGVMTAVSGYLVHEWGHLLGARMGRSVVHFPPGPFNVFLFNYDSDRNTRDQFLLMSMGGFAASAVAVTFLLLVLPLSAPASWIALGLTGLGVVATLALEIPPFLGVYGGGPIPRGTGYRSSET
jgi:hypothetical protein